MTDAAHGPAPTGARPGRLLEIVVFVVGAASLGAEIAAARLLAPWFGASTIVWANTIATVLVALSIGYALGGRLADRNPTLDGLGRIVLAAAALLAVVPFVAAPFLRLSLDAFSNFSAGMFLGSLLGVMVLVAVPVLLLGMVSPYAVRLRVDRVADAGRAAGRLYALSTVGSLVGTFLAALLLIPFVGTRRTFLGFALALALAALVAITRRRWRVAAAAVSVVVLGLMALPIGLEKPESALGKVIWERETEYQYARVIQTSTGVRELELNEGLAVHSKYVPTSYLTGGYWDDMLALCWAGASAPRSVAILGSAAGTTARALGHYSPGTTVDAVELDPAITQVGRQLFGLTGPRLHVHTADARPWLETSTATYDAILVDAYRQPYIPFYLTTEEFFREVRAHLNPGGVVVVNVGHPADSQDLEKVMTATIAAAFRTPVWRDPTATVSTMLVARADGGDPRQALATAPAGDVATLASGVASRLAPGLTGGEVFTDDKAPVEWLIDASLAHEAR